MTTPFLLVYDDIVLAYLALVRAPRGLTGLHMALVRALRGLTALYAALMRAPHSLP